MLYTVHGTQQEIEFGMNHSLLHEATPENYVSGTSYRKGDRCVQLQPSYKNRRIDPDVLIARTYAGGGKLVNKERLYLSGTVKFTLEPCMVR